MIPALMQFYLDLEFESENEKVHSPLTFKGYFNYKMKRMVDPYGSNAKHVMRTTKRPNKQVITTLF